MREGMASIFFPWLNSVTKPGSYVLNPFMQVSPGDGDVLVEMADVGVADN